VRDHDSRTPLSSAEPRYPEVAEELLTLLEQMAIIRATENAAQTLFLSGLVKGTTHLAAGQEAIAVGASSVLRPDDYVFATYRGHHHAIARGLAPEFCLAELMSKATGCCGAKGGSMHLTHTAGNMLGSYAIVGAHLPMACGAAWSSKLRGTQQVAVAFFGDGATNIGAFHEALNLAAVWALPAIFVCENNLYMEYTPIKEVTAVPRPAADRAGSYGLPAIVVDGNDVLAVRSAVEEAVTRARSGIGPTIIEAETYRHYGHSRSDPAKYRPQDEVEHWMSRDPLLVTQAKLIELGMDEEQISAVLARAKVVVDGAVATAQAAGPPTTADALVDVWADGGSTWRT
jgi:pyruvate dehydrogenase E1 component alpha subunit